MKVFFRINSFALALLITLFMGESLAAGIGFNMIRGGADLEWEAENWSHSGSDKDFDFDTEFDATGSGIIFDSAVGSGRVFNYRLNLGVERGDYKIDALYPEINAPMLSGSFETKGWFMSHDFGFRVFENSAIRLWLGPEIRYSKTEGDLDSNRD
jgi:hypothetical protein